MYDGKTLWTGVFVSILLAVIGIGAATYLGINYVYRWNQQCASVGGVKMENVTGGNVCVKGPVEIVTIAAKPW